MADTRDDYELRRRAVELHEAGVGFQAILHRLGRSRAWLAKWLHRFRTEGWQGLRSRSRAPKQQARQMPQRIVARVVAIRAELEARQTRRSRFSGIGGEVVRAELQRRRVRPLPSLSTIERILRQHGYPTRPPHRRTGSGEPYPAPRARFPGDVQQTDLVGPRHLRGPKGVTRFYSAHTVAVVGRGAATSQGRHKTAELLGKHFVQAWRWLGVPLVSQMDNAMAATGGGRHPYGFSWVMRLHLLLGVRLLFIPPSEPGRNAYVESFNGLWQERVFVPSLSGSAGAAPHGSCVPPLLSLPEATPGLAEFGSRHPLPGGVAAAPARPAAESASELLAGGVSRPWWGLAPALGPRADLLDPAC